MIMSDDRIKQWHPFLYRYMGIDGKRQEVTFTCPTCNGHNCEKLDELDHDVFWSGHYRCTDCGETKENGNALCFYSNAFVNKEMKPEPVQLSLWSE